MDIKDDDSSSNTNFFNGTFTSHIGRQYNSSPSVIVIGGGISGLAAAGVLQNASFKVILLESRDRIGGRIQTDYSFGCPVDMGASWLHGVCNENPLAPMIRRLGLNLYRTSGDNSVLYDHDLESFMLFGIDGKQVPQQTVVEVGDAFRKILKETEKVRDEHSQDMSVQQAISIVLDRYPELRQDGLADEVLQWYICRMEAWFAADANSISLKTWDENRARNPSMTGAYPQQGYQARPPTSWAPPGGQMQQPGYGYMQPGTYPGPSPQYSMPQQPYPGYPPQPTSAGYGTGWDQSNPNQQTAPGCGYDYYSQVPPQQQQPTSGGSAAPTDSTGAYGYNQQPSSGYSQGQSYSQDGYSGYHAPAPQSGYPNPVPGYDQQQGYNSTTGYSNTSNPAADGHTPSYGAQSDTSQPPANQSAGSQPGYHASQPGGYGIPTSQGGYGTQPPAYGNNYGQPPSQKPPASQPAYSQPQQSPSAQGGYAQPPQVYPHSQPSPTLSGYSQPDSGSQRAPSTGYGAPASQPGYGPPPYGAPQMTQSGVPYNSGYGGSGYSQASAYSTDGSGGGGGGARASYDTAPTSQSSQPTGSAKTSPQS